VQEGTEAIHDWLESHQEEIKAGQILVYALDECHVKNGDACGYLWGDRQERGEVIVENYRESQSQSADDDTRGKNSQQSVDH
jgi:hypothetical protein